MVWELEIIKFLKKEKIKKNLVIISKIIFSEKSLSVHMSRHVTSRPRPRPRPPKESLKLKTLLSKVVRCTIRVTKIHPESCCCH